MNTESNNTVQKVSKGTRVEDILRRFELDAIDQKILQLRIAYPAITDREIAIVVGLSRKRVNLRQQKEKFKNALSHHFSEPLELLKSGLKRAAEVILESMESPNEKVRLDAAVKLLSSEGIMNYKRENSPMESNVLRFEMPDAGEVIEVITGPSNKHP